MSHRILPISLVLLATAGVFLLLQDLRPQKAVASRVVAVVKSQGVADDATIVAAAAVKETTSTKSELRLLATGDVMLGRFVGTLVRRHGTDYPFQKIDLSPTAEYFPHNELLINLEGTIAGDDPSCATCMNFSFDEKVAPMLKRTGVTLAALANNHGLDRGEAGFAKTRKLLQDAGITPFGKLRYVGEDLSVVYKTYGEMKVAYIGFAVFPGFNVIDARELVAATEKKADRTIVAVHWGIEYQKKQSAQQTKLAHEWIDAGADAIIGHHPHVPQPVEEYKGRPIFYSLGNFVFDQYWSQETQRGLIVGLTMTKEKMEYETFTINLDKSQPRLAEK